jgi:WhiB family transcriptional regulator, redox-sensing transcriptional regulator
MKYPNFDDARCKEIGLELFFEDNETGQFVDVKKSKGICSGCPIVDICLEWALNHERHGIWGGTTPQERNEMRKKMNIILVEPKSIIGYGRKPYGLAK